MQSLCTLRDHCRQWPLQHSLPSGRYPLLGPDFHRLDRTSLRLAHLFDHLVSGREASAVLLGIPAHCGRTATAWPTLDCYGVLKFCKRGDHHMKKLSLGCVALAALITAPAIAADMAVKAPYRAAPPAWSWTGFYIGVNAGGGWDNNDVVETATSSFCKP